MELRINAKNLTVSDRFREYVQDKSGKIEQLAQRPQELNIKVIRHDHQKHRGQEDQVEITVYEPGHVVRAEARATDKFAAFDMAFGKLVERLRRYGDKHKIHRGGGHKNIGTSELTANDFAALDITPVGHDLLTGEIPVISEETGSSIVIRAKEFETIPMTAEEAVDRMELVGHDFYLYQDVNSGKTAVVYRRKGYNYGVISLK